jgi:hypothetical protein
VLPASAHVQHMTLSHDANDRAARGSDTLMARGRRRSFRRVVSHCRRAKEADRTTGPVQIHGSIARPNSRMAYSHLYCPSVDFVAAAVLVVGRKAALRKTQFLPWSTACTDIHTPRDTQVRMVCMSFCVRPVRHRSSTFSCTHILVASRLSD